MKECYLCGVSEDSSELHEGIQKNLGVVCVCNKCYFKERIPLISKKEINLEEIQRRGSVRERLSKIARVSFEKREEVLKEKSRDEELRKLVSDNVKKKVEVGPKVYDDLIENFHWAIMRKRRSMKMDRKQLANSIFESPVIIEALEGGALPSDYVPLIKKVEGFLHLKLFKNRERDISSDIIASEAKVATGIKVSDMKEKTREKSWFFAKKNSKEEVMPEELTLDKVKEISGEPVDEKVEGDISDEEMESLIWGKK